MDIDRVNKPFLPLAAGELSPALAWALCGALAAAGAGIVAANFGPLITGLYALGLLLGTVYSVPPLRLKRSPLPAFLIIATVRGVLLNFGVYYAARAALRQPFAWSPAVLFITVFVTVFATAIAITKDLPDVEVSAARGGAARRAGGARWRTLSLGRLARRTVSRPPSPPTPSQKKNPPPDPLRRGGWEPQGDLKFGVETFATRLGVRNIALLGTGLLLANYVGAVAAAALRPAAFNVPLMAGAHAVIGGALLWQAAALDRAKYSREAVVGFYRFIWNLFYAEYALLPFL